jgi:hypothetical protein
MGVQCLHCQANGMNSSTQIHPVILSWLGQNWDIEIGTDCMSIHCHTEYKINDVTWYDVQPNNQKIGQWLHSAPQVQECPRKPHVDCCCSTNTMQLTPKGIQSLKSG